MFKVDTEYIFMNIHIYNIYTLNALKFRHRKWAVFGDKWFHIQPEPVEIGKTAYPITGTSEKQMELKSAEGSMGVDGM